LYAFNCGCIAPLALFGIIIIVVIISIGGRGPKSLSSQKNAGPCNVRVYGERDWTLRTCTDVLGHDEVN